MFHVLHVNLDATKSKNRSCRQACRDLYDLNRLASPLVRVHNSWSGGHEFESPAGHNLVRPNWKWENLWVRSSTTSTLKGVWHEIFDFRFFFVNQCSPGPCRWHRRTVYRRCRWHRWYTFIRDYIGEFSEKNEMILMEYSGARGTLSHEKKLKTKISCHTPFKMPKCEIFERSDCHENLTLRHL